MYVVHSMKDKVISGKQGAPSQTSTMTLFGSGSHGGSRNPGFLLSVAVMSFLSGILTSSLVSLLKCNCPPPQQIIQQQLAPVACEYQISKISPTVIDWSSTDFGRFMTDCATPLSQDAIKPLLINRVYNGRSPFTDFPPDFVKPYLQNKYIHGWGSTGSVFKRLLEEVRPKIIIELGSFLGASATHMATLAKSMFDHQVLILCTDDFRLWPGYHGDFKIHEINGDAHVLYQFMYNVQMMNVSDYILPMPFSTSAALNVLCAWGVTVDLIEVDAGHDFHSAWSDINLAYSLLRPGGIMFGHDYYLELDDKGVKRAVDLFAKLKGLGVEVDGEHWILRGRQWK